MPKETLNWRIHTLIKKGVLQRIGRGKFKIGETVIFNPELSSKIEKINSFIKKQFPFISYCLWETGVINELSLHLNKINFTIVDVEKPAANSVFLLLKEHYKHVFYHPDKELITGYLSGLQHVIIVRNLISEAPVQKVYKIPSITIEKLLVDLFSDTEFEFLHGNELSVIYQNAFEKYTINESKLLRYASRKGKKTDIHEFIKNLKIGN